MFAIRPIPALRSNVANGSNALTCPIFSPSHVPEYTKPSTASSILVASKVNAMAMEVDMHGNKISNIFTRANTYNGVADYILILGRNF